MTFTERLQQSLDKAASKEVYNSFKKEYEWKSEANQKRSVR